MQWSHFWWISAKILFDETSVNNKIQLKIKSILQCFGSALISSGSGSSILGECGSGSRSRVLMTKNWKKLTAEKTIFFWSKIAICLSLGLPKRTYKLHEKPSAFKKERPALQNMKFQFFFSIFVGNFCPPGYGSSRTKSMRIRITGIFTKHAAKKVLPLCCANAKWSKPWNYSKKFWPFCHIYAWKYYCFIIIRQKG